MQEQVFEIKINLNGTPDMREIYNSQGKWRNYQKEYIAYTKDCLRIQGKDPETYSFEFVIFDNNVEIDRIRST